MSDRSQRAPRTLAAVAACLLAAAGCAALDAGAAPPETWVLVGETAPGFTLPVAGAARRLTLGDELRRQKLTVVMFIATQCPVSNAYNSRMAELARDYATRGVGFVGVNSNRQEPVEEIVAHAREHGLAFPIVKDAENKIADRYGARVTPEVFVVDTAGVVRYHGRIDERQNAATPADVKSPDLRTALDALLAGKAPPSPTTKAFGCSIKRI